MIRLLYNLLFPVALLVFLPGYVVKMLRRGNYRDKFGQRLGLLRSRRRAQLARRRQRTWLHAVSVGEVMIALKLARKMKEREPNLRVALTTTTTTGFALARRRRRNGSRSSTLRSISGRSCDAPSLSFVRAASSWWKPKSGPT